MPRMGGIELLEVLRSSVPDVDCIIVTGQGTLEKAEAVTALGPSISWKNQWTWRGFGQTC